MSSIEEARDDDASFDCLRGPSFFSVVLLEAVITFETLVDLGLKSSAALVGLAALKWLYCLTVYCRILICNFKSIQSRVILLFLICCLAPLDNRLLLDDVVRGEPRVDPVPLASYFGLALPPVLEFRFFLIGRKLNFH